jgi:hypothetical protein
VGLGSWFGRFGGEKYILHVPEIEPQSLGRPARCSYYTDYATREEWKQRPRRTHKIIKKDYSCPYYALHHEDIWRRYNSTPFVLVLCT